MQTPCWPCHLSSFPGGNQQNSLEGLDGPNGWRNPEQDSWGDKPGAGTLGRQTWSRNVEEINPGAPASDTELPVGDAEGSCSPLPGAEPAQHGLVEVPTHLDEGQQPLGLRQLLEVVREGLGVFLALPNPC